MFRRRTDQVYATLQQVQRRITEQSANQSAAGAQDAGGPHSASPLQDALGRQIKPNLIAMQAEVPPLPANLGPVGRSGVLLSISKSFAVTLIVLWLASDVGFFVLGSHAGDRHGPAEAGYAEDGPGGRSPATSDGATTARGPGTWVLVLKDVDAPTQDDERTLQKRAQDLNQTMLQNSSRGWKPWFGVRKPVNGHLELVFGEVAPNSFGVSQQDWGDFARIIKQPPPNGAGYPGAVWEQLP